MLSDFKYIWCRAGHVKQKAAFTVVCCAAIYAIITCTAGDISFKESINRLLNFQSLAFPTTLLYLCIVWLGFVPLSPMEQIRVGIRREFLLNLRWLVTCSLLFTVLYIGIWLVSFFSLPGYHWSENIPHLPLSLALLTVSMLLYLLITGLALYIMAGCGMPWGYCVILIPMLLLILYSAIQILNPTITCRLFCNVTCMQSTLFTLTIQRFTPWSLLAILLIAIDWSLVSRHDRLNPV